MERWLLNGCSWQLIINGFKSIDWMTDVMAIWFLWESGYETTWKQVMCSCTLRDFYELFEKVLALCEDKDEILLANQWSESVWKEAELFDKNVDELIAELEKIEFDRWTGKITKSA